MSRGALFPEISGTEEEIRIGLWNETRNQVGPTINSEAANLILQFMDGHCQRLPGNKQFRKNGARTYVDQNCIELATAECDDPDTQISHINANADLLIDSASDWLQDAANRSERPHTAVMQRRVIDGNANTWGYHDNFSFKNPLLEEQLAKPTTAAGGLMAAFLYSRPFITGAGLVRQDGVSFSQKLSQPHEYDSYGYGNSLLRVDSTHGLRFEVRCNDVNLLDWAARARLGSAALVLAAAQTGLVDELAALADSLHIPMAGGSSVFAYNAASFDNNMQLAQTEPVVKAAVFQRRLHKIILDKIDKYGEAVPSVYQQIGQEVIRYCDDFLDVLEGKKDFESLATRADWAAKMRIIRRHIQRKPNDRHLLDATSEGADLLYDRITIIADSKKLAKPQVHEGFGYRQARQHRLVSNDAIVTARKRPPANTRAHERVRLATNPNAELVDCTWHEVKILHRDDNWVDTRELAYLYPNPAGSEPAELAAIAD